MITDEPILVTGVAGFIGLHVALRLLRDGIPVAGVDNLCDYGGRQLKEDRLSLLAGHPRFRFQQLDLCDAAGAAHVVGRAEAATVIHLAAQPGVRHSLSHPLAHVHNNVVATANLLEACRQHHVAHLVYASSSSVYGASRRLPYRERHGVDHPVSLYAATKKATELMAHSYAHLYGLPSTGLRFFTVYGPWGRTDMAPHLFTEAILAGRPLQLFNHGRSRRDFTFIDDVVEGVLRVVRTPAAANPAWSALDPDPGSSAAPFRVYNLGNGKPIDLLDFVAALEHAIGLRARVELLPAQPGDVGATHADTTRFARDFAFQPATPMAAGVARYVDWFRRYYRR